MKRVVCGRGADLDTVLLCDEPQPNHHTGGTLVTDVWTLASRHLDTEDLTATTPLELALGSEEARFRIVSMPPTPPETFGTRMHRTRTIDLAVVLSGEMDLAMEDGSETHLTPGDCIVQIAGVHEWRNRGSSPCVLAFVVLGVEPASEKKEEALP